VCGNSIPTVLEKMHITQQSDRSAILVLKLKVSEIGILANIQGNAVSS